jgi:hypothetical protein
MRGGIHEIIPGIIYNISTMSIAMKTREAAIIRNLSILRGTIVIREASIEDGEAWDSFVDAQEGHVGNYFNWKYVVETGRDSCIQLIMETDSSQMIGIFPVTKSNKFLYSVLSSWTGSGGPLIRKDLAEEDKHLAVKMFIQYLDAKYSIRCSRSRLMEMVPPGMDCTANPRQANLQCGYRLKYDERTGLPCNFVLELKPPFEQNIWMGLWSPQIRQAIRKVEKNGVTVIEDRDMRYAETYISFMAANHIRHGETPLTSNEILAELKVFKDKTRLFVALKENTPVVILCCHYTPSTCYLWRVGSATKDTDNINKYTYKVAIENACNSGYRFVDFGVTAYPGLATLKERFCFTRIPMRIYEKRYSIPRTMIETMGVASLMIKKGLHNKYFLWNSLHKILGWIPHWQYPKPGRNRPAVN